jgi:hypothetical protein
MNIKQVRLRGGEGSIERDEAVDLVLAFGCKASLSQRYEELREAFPKAQVFGCTTAGNIAGTDVFDDGLALTSVQFEKSRARVASVDVSGPAESFDAGVALARRLHDEALVHVFVLSDGILVNGTELVRGLRQVLPARVAVTGGLAGDGERMKETHVCANAPARSGVIAALGLFGSSVHVGFGSMGGWDPFGPERLITRADGNVLYELDGESALELYKRYLGEHAAGLPATGLLFPLVIRAPHEREGVVRTVLGVSEADSSLTFAGDMPQGHLGRLMKANLDRLVDGAYGAARLSLANGAKTPSLALLVSCVGRRMILRQRVEEEVECVREVLGNASMTGFYSYGELCPNGALTCELHNQTMTITTITEA